MIRIPLLLVGVAIAAALGCNGEIGDAGVFTLPAARPSAGAGEARAAARPSWQAIDRRAGGPAVGSGAPFGNAPNGGAQAPAEAPRKPAFGIDHSQPALLPLDMRLRRLASAVGIGVDDPLLDPARDARIALGGYDHAQGVLPDGLWIASRLASWVRVLRPICASPAMHERYPDLPEALPALIRAAWGRSAQPADLADFEEELAASALDPAARYEAICLAVFSAAEFVYQ
jgi:hypothetical protein